MKLIKANIQAFGNLKDREIDFSDTLTCIFGPNGYGKTTIASFLRAMFYDIPNATKSSFERKRFLPLSDEPCKGSLELEFKGDIYRIEKLFGKRMNQDVTGVYQNGKIIDLKMEPGLYFLGLDLDSFDKTMFLHPEDMTLSSNMTINGKISQFVQKSGNDNLDLESVLQRLNDEKKKLKPMKNAQTSGLIFEKKQKVLDLELKRSQLNELRSGLPSLLQKKEEMDKSVQDLKEELNKAALQNVRSQELTLYRNLIEKEEKCRKLLKEAEEEFPKGFPTSDEIHSLRRDNFRLNQLQTEMNQDSLSQEEKRILSQDDRFFRNGVVEDSKLNEIQKNILVFQSLKRQDGQNWSETEEREYEFLSKHSSLLDEMDDLYNELFAFQKDNSPTKENKPYPLKKKNPWLPLGLILAVLLLVVGTVLGFVMNPMLFFITGIGFLLLLAVGFLHLEKKTNRMIQGPSDNTRGKNDDRIASVEEELRKRFAVFSMEEDSLLEGYSDFVKIKEKYKSLETRKQIHVEQERQHNQKLEECIRTLDEFFQDYPLEGDYQDRMNVLQEKKSEYLSLKSKKESADATRAKQNEEIKAIQARNDEFKARWKVDDILTYLSTVEQDKEEVRHRKEDYEKSKTDRENFQKEKNIREGEEPKMVDTELLSRNWQALLKEKADLDQDIKDKDFEVERLEEETKDLDSSRKEYECLVHKYEILNQTVHYLTLSKENLTKKYIAPMKERLDHYQKLLESAFRKDIDLDVDFNVGFLENGTKEDHRYLSTGELVLCLLCYRLSLIDNIFKGEKVFLVLDDLLASLDDKNLKIAKKFLLAISQEYQLVYFTCHESRVIEM